MAERPYINTARKINFSFIISGGDREGEEEGEVDYI
jgi:hypothetical protein